jgi:hypothetical protein
VYSAVLGTPPIVLVLVLVLVLDFFGRGKRADCQQRSKIENENEDDDEDDWRGVNTALSTYSATLPARRQRLEPWLRK